MATVIQPADPHADAPEVEVISPNEALQRQRSGGFLANGQRAPAAAVVDTQAGPAGGGVAPAPKQPAAQSKPVDPNADPDDAYWGGPPEPREVTPAKGKKPKAKEVDPDDAYWGGPVEPPPPPPAKPAPRPSLWRQAVDKIGSAGYSAAQGLGGSTASSSGALNTVAAPLIQSANTWYNLITGKIKSLGQDAPTDWQDTWFRHTVDPTVEHAQDFATDQSASFADKASHAVGAVLGYLSQAILTGGAGEELTSAEIAGGNLTHLTPAAEQTGLQAAGEVAAHGIKAAQAPAVAQAVNVGREAYQSTNDPQLAFKLAAITYSSSVEQNMMPLAMPGKLATRMATGGGMQLAGGEASREASNAAIPEDMTDQQKRGLSDDALAEQNAKEQAYDTLRQPFSAEDAVLNLVQGAAMGGIAGPRAQMPHQAVEVPQNIMERAQIAVAQDVKANGGDMLDQTVAASHVNAVLSAHHDAAAFEAHHETRLAQAAEEAAVQQQHEEQNAREMGLNDAQEAAAPQGPPIDTLFARREQAAQAQRDQDYKAALNQRGDEEIARGETLAAGAEKGGEVEPKPTIADSLSPEQRQAFENLKARRAAEAPPEQTVAERLKAQEPDDNFTPFTESPKKAAVPEPAEPPKTSSARRQAAVKPPETLQARREASAIESPTEKSAAEPEPPVEGDEWHTKEGASYEVLKDNLDGTFMVRSTPADSSQAPMRRKMSGTALAILRARTEATPEAESEAEAAPTTLAERRAAAAELSPDSQRIAKRFAAEKAFNADANYQRLMNAKPGEHEALTADMPLEEARQHLDRLDAAPGQNAAAESALKARIEAGRADVEAGAHEAATSPKSDEPMPTEAQQNAGNFKMGKIEVAGLPISIEHPEGSTRPSGATIRDGHYGYVRGTVDADGMHTDVFVGKHPESDTAFVVDHLDRSGEYEQHKLLMGFPSKLAALRAYRSAYPENKLGPVSEVKTSELKDWLKNGDTTKPYDLKGVNRLGDSRRFSSSPPAEVRPEDVRYAKNPNGTHTAETAHGKTTLLEKPNGNLQVRGTETSAGMRGAGEGTARLERAAREAHTNGGKLESDNRVSAPAQAIYQRLKDRGYDIKENPSRIDPGTGEKISASELRPVYEVGPKTTQARDTAPGERRGPAISKEEATQRLQPLIDKVGADRLQVHDSPSDPAVPQSIRDDMAAFNHPDPRGVYDPNSGVIHVFAGANGHASLEDIHDTAVHELAHHGVRGFLGDDYAKAMSDIYANLHDHVSALSSPIDGVNKASGKSWIRDYADVHDLDLRNARHQQMAADEYIAHLAGHDIGDPAQENPSVLRRAIDAVRAGLRKLGVVHEWTDNDVRRLLRESANNMESEHARAALEYKGNGLRFADSEDRGTERFAPDHPLSVAHKFGRTMEDQANYNPGFIRSRLDWFKDKAANTTDSRLAFIGLRNLPDFMNPKLMPSLRQFVRIHDQMSGRSGELSNKSADLAKDWSRYVSKDKVRGGALGELMHSSTLVGVDPSKPFENRYTDEQKKANPEKQTHEEMRRDYHRIARDVFNRQLDDKGREVFNRVRDHYAQQRLDTQKALEQRINESSASESSKRALVDTLRQKFESGRVQGPYFPLTRFGNHWASAKDEQGNTVSFSRFESRSQQQAWLKEMSDKGLKVDGGQKLDDKATAAHIDPAFVAKISSMANDVSPALADEIWQTYLKAIPDVSLRKQFMHRQGRLGYSMDALRAFASNSFHGAKQIARLEYGHRLDSTLDDIKGEARAVEAADPGSKNSQWAPALAREMSRRNEWIKNPHSSAWANALTKFGYCWYLGAAPATAFRIFSQNPMLAQPVLAGYHGQIGATRELLRASAQWATAKGSLGDRLRGDERLAFDTAKNTGVFSNNNTHILASGGGEGAPMFTGWQHQVQKVATFLFQGMENHNRQTTFLAAYRLGRTQGMTHGEAVEHAADRSWDAHFDYSSANRPRVMQNDVTKVLGLFKSYSWGVTYRLAREARDMFDSELAPADRTIAKKTFAGLLARQMMFSGVTGLPLYWVAEAAINSVMGDKDRPFDVTAALHKQLNDQYGDTVGDAVMTGPVGAISGASLSGGASYNDLWYRPPSRDENAHDSALDVLAQVAGAVPAIPLNMATGAGMMKDGHIERGLEHFVPPEAAALMKAHRYSQEGAKTLSGEDVVKRDDISDKDLFLQSAGFTPQRLADQFAENSALENVSKAITDRRSRLVDQYANSIKMNDESGAADAFKGIEAFNATNPTYSIPAGAIARSVRDLYMHQAEAVNGVRLPKGLQDLHNTY